MAVVEQVFRRAHEYANHASRARPIATDVMLACKEYCGLETKHLHRVELMAKKRRQGTLPRLSRRLHSQARTHKNCRECGARTAHTHTPTISLTLSRALDIR